MAMVPRPLIAASAADELQRMPDVIDHAARRLGPRLRIRKWQKIVLHQPDQMRRHDDKRDQDRQIRPRRAPVYARVAVEDHEQRHRGRQHHHEIFGP